MADYKTVPLSPEEEQIARNLFPADPKKQITPLEAKQQLEIARQNYLTMMNDTNRIIARSNPLTTGFPGMVSGLPGINYLTKSTRAGVLRQNIETVKNKYGIEKIGEMANAGISLAPYTPAEITLIQNTAGALDYGGPESELDRQIADMQNAAMSAYIREAEKYKALYGKLPPGYDVPSRSKYPTIQSLPGFKPRKPTRP